MIYLGIKLFPQAFKITALSDNFALLGQRYFTIEQHYLVDPWLATLTWEPQEPMKWFFDDSEFHNPTYPAKLFELVDSCQQIYLVNHRKLADLMHLVHDWNGHQFNPPGRINHHLTRLPAKPEITFFLASAQRIFAEEYLTPFQWDEPF